MRSFVLEIFGFLSSRFGYRLIRHRLLLVIGVQLLLIIAANLLAFLLRFDGDIPPGYWDLAVRAFPLVLLSYVSGLWMFGLYSGLWRYVGLHDLTRIIWACLMGTSVLYGLLHIGMGWATYPRSVIILTGVLVAGSLAAIRLGVRCFREWLQIVGPSARRVLIVGAGNAGEQLARDMHSDARYNYKPVGFVDDDPVKRKMKIHGVPVVGGIADIPSLARGLVVHEIIVAIPSASTALKQRILVASEGCKIPIKILPSVKQLLANPEALRQVRPMSLEDLLQREPIQMDRQELHPLLEGKRVLVTGAGGSIGSELCRQIARYRPATLILFERYENGLYALDLELRRQFPDVAIVPAVGDVTIHDRVIEVLRQTDPELVFHAAAHKHVPLMELNPKEAVRNNVFGTKVVAEAALACGVDRFVLISTDKAVNPTSVMGATKRVAEDLLQRLSYSGQTKFTVVRFGNVLGSNGSVVPLFTDQIRRGGPVTVTHPEIKRFFMTIPEAVQLVLQASLLGRGGEVFVLDMGEQVKVVDLARNMIVLSGLVPDQDIQIVYSGLRPGEKLYEELFEAAEQVEPTAHAKIRRAISPPVIQSDRLDRAIAHLETALSHGDDDELIRRLNEAVPTYTPMSARNAVHIH
ncbi:MAG: nucleoside-diphosphate sugar epimerase/dehydratase [Nitrospirota bacterium]|nr:nucleoside-diphosphate sugar epimerase/dehydratase [Nitrospirota bacterium]